MIFDRQICLNVNTTKAVCPEETQDGMKAQYCREEVKDHVMGATSINQPVPLTTKQSLPLAYIKREFSILLRIPNEPRSALLCRQFSEHWTQLSIWIDTFWLAINCKAKRKQEANWTSQKLIALPKSKNMLQRSDSCLDRWNTLAKAEWPRSMKKVNVKCS